MKIASARTAIVTGGSRGIGRAIAVALAELGSKVAINYNSNREAADEAADLVKQAGGEAITVQADIGSIDDHEKLLSVTEEAFGPVDLLVNNAGVAPKIRADMLEMPEESYDFVLDTNLRGPYFLTQRVANHMIASNAGDNEPPAAIVNIGSISAYAASTNRAEYCLAKAGIGMMTQLFASRLAEYGINVYEIRPGIIATDMTSGVKEKYDKLILEEGITPIRRWGKPEDIANAVAAIAEAKFPFSTGEVFNVDGGFHLKRL